MTLLNRELARLPRPDVAVVSDRYPPNSFGGAEVSLHLQLRGMGLGSKLVVITFNDHALAPSVSRVEGVTVLQLPRQGSWPHHARPRALEKSVPHLDSIFGSARRWLGRRDRSERSGGSDGDAASSPAGRSGFNELLNQLAAKHPRGGVVADPVEYTEGLGAAMVRRVLHTLNPRLIHADNHRSILIVASASRGLRARRVGVVRDNRFHCPRHDQSLRCRGGRRSVCEFQCAEQDCSAAPELQHRMLELVLAYRVEALRSMDDVVVTSRYLQEAIAGVVGAKNVTRVPNAADDVAQADTMMAGVAERPGINVLVVGMINENKGQLQLVRSLEGLVGSLPDLVLHFAGRGARIEKQLRALAKEVGLSHRLVFHGHVERASLYALYRQTQVVALPTQWPEPFGRVPLEAGLASRPCVSFALGGLRESIVHDRSGLLVSPGDMPGFVKQLVTLGRSPALRRTFGHHARRHVLENYSVEQAQHRLAKLWAIGGHCS